MLTKEEVLSQVYQTHEAVIVARKAARLNGMTLDNVDSVVDSTEANSLIKGIYKGQCYNSSGLFMIPAAEDVWSQYSQIA